jgi:hypothetical protein
MILDLVLALASIAVLLAPWLMDAGMSHQLRKAMKAQERQSNHDLQDQTCSITGRPIGAETARREAKARA